MAARKSNTRVAKREDTVAMGYRELLLIGSVVGIDFRFADTYSVVSLSLLLLVNTVAFIFDVMLIDQYDETQQSSTP